MVLKFVVGKNETLHNYLLLCHQLKFHTIQIKKKKKTVANSLEI